MTPTTEAGKRLVNSQVWVGVARDLAAEVAAIEDEARAPLIAAIEKFLTYDGRATNTTRAILHAALATAKETP